MNYKSKIFVCSVILLTLILGCILSTKPAISEKPNNQIIVENSTVEVITENKKAQGIDSSSSMSNSIQLEGTLCQLFLCLDILDLLCSQMQVHLQ